MGSDILLPPGVSSVRDLPFTVFEAVREALTFISFDELPEDERPPRRMWNDRRALSRWFRRVRAMRKQKYGGGDDDDAWDKPIEDPVRNEAARDLIRGR